VLGEAAQGTDEAALRVPAGAPRFPRVLSRLRRALTAPPGSAWRDPVAWAIAVLSFGAYFVLSLYRLLTLHPASYDLGIFTEFARQLSQLHAPVDDILAPGFNLEGDHFQAAVGVIAPFFRILPTPATLLFFQALLTAVSVFPVVTVASLCTGRSTGRLIGFAYAFSWGLQEMISFDFHEIAIAVPLLAFAVSALVRRRPVAVIWWAAPLVLVKEDQGFTVAAIGMLMAATAVFPSLLSVGSASSARPPQDYRYPALWGGVFLVGWGAFCSEFAITVIIPHFNPLHEYRYWGAAGGVVGTVGGQPGSAATLLAQLTTSWPVKLTTVVLLLLPTAFFALGSPVALLAIPSLVLRFISTDTSYWGTGWHYNATVMPILFIAVAEAIGRWQRRPALARQEAPGAQLSSPPAAVAAARLLRGIARRWRGLVRAAEAGAARHGGAMMAAIAVALAFQFPISGLWHGSTYALDARVAAADAAMAVVPDGVTVTTTTDLLAPLAARTDTFWIENSGNPATQYIVFDAAYSPPPTSVPQFIAAYYGKDAYVQVFARDGVYVYHRRG
jgi:uncharacterized membrane protein